jgi:hypothetical protein
VLRANPKPNTTPIKRTRAPRRLGVIVVIRSPGGCESP